MTTMHMPPQTFSHSNDTNSFFYFKMADRPYKMAGNDKPR